MCDDDDTSRQSSSCRRLSVATEGSSVKVKMWSWLGLGVLLTLGFVVNSAQAIFWYCFECVQSNPTDIGDIMSWSAMSSVAFISYSPCPLNSSSFGECSYTYECDTTDVTGQFHVYAGGMFLSLAAASYWRTYRVTTPSVLVKAELSGDESSHHRGAQAPASPHGTGEHYSSHMMALERLRKSDFYRSGIMRWDVTHAGSMG